MKTLYIMTHPPKDTDSLEDDFFIPLSQKGIDDVKTIANGLKELEIQPDIIVSSPSLCTETTSMILSDALDVKKTILYNEVLYQGFLEELIESINFTFYSVETLLIVGHTHLLSNLAHHFVGYKDKMSDGMVIKIAFNTSSWVEVSAQNASFEVVIK